MSSLVFVNQDGSTPETGYGGRHFYLARELAKNTEVMLLVAANHHLLRNPPKYKGWISDENCQGVKVRWVKLLPYSSVKSPIRVLNWFIFAALIPFLLFNHKFSCIHFSSPSPVGFLGAWLSGRLKKAKVFFDVRDVWPETLISVGNISRKHPLILLLCWVERFAYRKSDLITSNLPNFDIRLKELDVEPSKFVWIPNGVFLGEANRSQVESSFSFPDHFKNKKIVCYTGTFGEANNLQVLLDAALILKNDSEIVFVLVGDGEKRFELEEFRRRNGLTNIEFIGPITKRDIYKVHSLSDVLCVGAKALDLYRYGVAANKLYEYIYSNRSVLYYIDTPYYFPVKDSRCGIQVSNADGHKLAVAIEALLREPEKFNHGEGRAYIQQYHSYSKIASKMLEICL